MQLAAGARMDSSKESLADGYESFYRDFDLPLMRRLRREAYGEDIGQHSWVGAEELRGDIRRLEVSPSSRLLDLGCGPCGPLTFLLASVGCRGTGVELSPSALRVGRTRAASLGIDSLLSVQEADLNQPLPFEPGHTQFVAPGWNEGLLEAAGFRLIETENRTPSVLRNASGRLAAMQAHRAELEELTSATDFENQRVFLETVVELSRRGAVSRVMYLAEAQVPTAV
jgi:SAM-dependent methyltransferase